MGEWVVQLPQRMKQTRFMGNSMFSDHSVAGGRTRRSCNARAAAAHAGNQTGGFGTASHSSIRVLFFLLLLFLQVSQRGCVGHCNMWRTSCWSTSGSHKWAEVWAVGRPRRSLYCLVLEIVCRSPGSARPPLSSQWMEWNPKLKQKQEEEEGDTAATSAVALSIKQSAWPFCVLCTVSRCCQSGGN